MNYEIVEETDLSGEACYIYSVLPEGAENTLFEDFVDEYFDDNKYEVGNIYNRLRVIGSETGARECFFKINEGKPGDGVCALYDIPGSKLRLYCIVYGRVAVILGGGGLKSKNIRRWEDDSKLKANAEFMINFSKKVSEAIKEKDIRFEADGRMTGNLIINDE